LTARSSVVQYPLARQEEIMPEQWLTYEAAGRQLGMSAEAIRHRARRLGWRTQPGNDGRTLVLVPDETGVRPRVRPPVQAPVQPPVHTAGHPGELAAALREQIAALQEQLAKAEAQADRERQDHQAERGRLTEELWMGQERPEQARAALAVERERWEARLDGLADDLAEERKGRVLAELEEVRLRAELERLQARPWWRKLFGLG
jgi:hypothetical protein